MLSIKTKAQIKSFISTDISSTPPFLPQLSNLPFISSFYHFAPTPSHDPLSFLLISSLTFSPTTTNTHTHTHTHTWAICHMWMGFFFCCAVCTWLVSLDALKEKLVGCGKEGRRRSTGEMRGRRKKSSTERKKREGRKRREKGGGGGGARGERRKWKETGGGGGGRRKESSSGRWNLVGVSKNSCTTIFATKHV